MKKFFKVAGSLAVMALMLAGATDVARADVNLIPGSVLKSQGVDISRMVVVGFSQDNKLALGYAREPKNNNLRDFVNKVYVFTLGAGNNISKVRSYPIDCPNIEQLAFTPDGRAVVIVTKQGATILRLDVASGQVTTLMEHVSGQPGFRCYPPVLTTKADQLLIQGYYYNKNDECGPNSIVAVDADKKGIDAFTYLNDLDRAQLSTRKHYLTFVENYPSQDVGFMGMNSGRSWTCYAWIGGPTTKQFDKAKELLGFWGGGNRVLYSVKRSDKHHDLMVYDATADKKFTISEGREEPYMYLFLSNDGKTALFNDADDTTKTTKLFFAREEDNWAIKPIKHLDKRISTGEMRISADGKKCLHRSKQGLRIIDIE